MTTLGKETRRANGYAGQAVHEPALIRLLRELGETTLFKAY